ncbi:copper amine oxidase N-terminal domain-containing protein [Paenibacillus sp. MMS20-IR301]|uniref:copper amine oxidase N-terminal domain-containing protein n=1 Tax=Paenibacillus sp. MMS20-IR301 TaxID=2895946 RepID=UPI0028EDDBBA|nr:copper amine oxidase N-terminal domain-containing protein [Paenibacillus sp. MMS20-IR301]WNS43412.1 copper amine oxidase N-terminal domain-containing protein [Paenibacillus sp. MMS20-IR301]
MKRIWSFLLVISFVSVFAASAEAASGNKDITVIIDGVKQNYSAKPVNVKGSVLVPMRAIFETLQAKVYWNQAKQQITAARGTSIITLTLNSTDASIDGKLTTLNAPPQTVNGNTMIPLRFVADALRADVKWDTASQTVTIDSKGHSTAVSNVAPPAANPEEDKAQIVAVLAQSIDSLSNGDGPGYLDAWDKTSETLQSLENYFSTQSYRYSMEGTPQIQLNGSSASAQLTQIASRVEDKGLASERPESVQRGFYTVNLIKRTGGWKIQSLTLYRTPENVPVADSKVDFGVYGLIRNMTVAEYDRDIQAYTNSFTGQSPSTEAIQQWMDRIHLNETLVPGSKLISAEGTAFSGPAASLEITMNVFPIDAGGNFLENQAPFVVVYTIDAAKENDVWRITSIRLKSKLEPEQAKLLSPYVQQ